MTWTWTVTETIALVGSAIAAALTLVSLGLLLASPRSTMRRGLALGAAVVLVGLAIGITRLGSHLWDWPLWPEIITSWVGWIGMILMYCRAERLSQAYDFATRIARASTLELRALRGRHGPTDRRDETALGRPTRE